MSFQRFWATIAVAAALAACSRDAGNAAQSKPKSPPEIFVDATESTGLTFTHTNGMSGEFYFSEIIGPGIALLDYDNDGKLDVLVLQGTPLVPGKPTASAECAARLFHNDLVINPDGTRTLKFTDVTAKSGLCSRGYGMGIAVGDFDNDGFVDVFITHFGAPNQLFHNNGDGTFTDVTERA